MNPGKISGANHSFGAPPDWNAQRDGGCSTLPVLNTGAQLQSAWFPSPEELAALNQGAPVILSIWGSAHPVVSLGVAPTPAAAEMMCDHGKTAAEGCARCADPDAPIPDDQVPKLYIPTPPRRRQ